MNQSLNFFLHTKNTNIIKQTYDLSDRIVCFLLFICFVFFFLQNWVFQILIHIQHFHNANEVENLNSTMKKVQFSRHTLKNLISSWYNDNSVCNWNLLINKIEIEKKNYRYVYIIGKMICAIYLLFYIGNHLHKVHVWYKSNFFSNFSNLVGFPKQIQLCYQLKKNYIKIIFSMQQKLVKNFIYKSGLKKLVFLLVRNILWLYYIYFVI